MKKCSTCNEIKDLEDFYSHPKTKDGKAYKCKACACEYQVNYNEDYTPKRSYYTPEKYMSNPDKYKIPALAYAKRNPAKMAARAMARYAAKLLRTPKWLTKSDHIEIAWAYQIAVDKTLASGIKHEVDHIVPLQGK